MKQNHRHQWELIMSEHGKTKRHCFGCNTTQELITATKWEKCATAKFWGIDPNTGKRIR